MLVAKQVADFITIARGVLAFWLAWLGFILGKDGLPNTVWIILAAWTGDSLDGPIARRSRVRYNSWVGDHDLAVDMLVSAGLLIYLLAAGFVLVNIVAVYLLAWLVIFWRLGVPRSLGMLFQAPIYGWFIWVAVRNAPGYGWWLVVWIVVALIATWPLFPQEIVPGFLSGMDFALRRRTRR